MIDWPHAAFMAALFVPWFWGVSQFARLQRLEEACERAWFALNGELLRRHALALEAANACPPGQQALAGELTSMVRECATRAGCVGDPERMDNEARLTEGLSRLTTDRVPSGNSEDTATLSVLAEGILRSEQRIREALEAHNLAVTVLNAAMQERTSGLIARRVGIQARPPLPQIC